VHSVVAANCGRLIRRGKRLNSLCAFSLGGGHWRRNAAAARKDNLRPHPRNCLHSTAAELLLVSLLHFRSSLSQQIESASNDRSDDVVFGRGPGSLVVVLIPGLGRAAAPRTIYSSLCRLFTLYSRRRKLGTRIGRA